MPATTLPNPTSRIVDYRQASLEMVVIVAVLLGLAAGVCAAIGHVGVLPLAAASAALCLGVALLSLLVTWAKSRSGLVTLVRAVMVSQFLRLFLGTAAFFLLVAVFHFGIRQSFVWILGWYWLLLIVEVWQLKRFVAKSIARDPTPASMENSSP